MTLPLNIDTALTLNSYLVIAIIAFISNIAVELGMKALKDSKNA